MKKKLNLAAALRGVYVGLTNSLDYI